MVIDKWDPKNKHCYSCYYSALDCSREEVDSDHRSKVKDLKISCQYWKGYGRNNEGEK